MDTIIRRTDVGAAGGAASACAYPVRQSSGHAALAQNSHALPLVLSADSAPLEGFVRIANYSNRAGSVRIHAVDDTSRRFGPASLALSARETVNFNFRDIEQENASKCLTTGLGDGAGHLVPPTRHRPHYRPSGLHPHRRWLRNQHARPRRRGRRQAPSRPALHPSSNRNQRNRLRLVNLGDDAGRAAPGRDVRLTLAAGAAHTLIARKTSNPAPADSTIHTTIGLNLLVLRQDPQSEHRKIRLDSEKIS